MDIMLSALEADVFKKVSCGSVYTTQTMMSGSQLLSTKIKCTLISVRRHCKTVRVVDPRAIIMLSALEADVCKKV